jgi:hypothetical protein
VPVAAVDTVDDPGAVCCAMLASEKQHTAAIKLSLSPNLLRFM